VSDESWRQLAVELSNDGAWIRRISVEIADLIHRQLPQLGSDSKLSEATRESVADNIWLFVSMVVADVPPDRARPRTLAEEYVRLLVQRGVAVETVIATYRVAVQAFWSVWSELLRERIAPAELAEAMDASTRFMLAFIDALTQQVVDVHVQEHRVWVRSGEAVRTETIQALLDDSPIDLEAAERRLGYRLGRRHRCAVVWSDEDAADTAFVREAAAEAIAMLGGSGSLLLEVNRSTVAAWTAVAGDPAQSPAALVPSGVVVALGMAETGVAGFRQTYQDAMHARRVAILRDLPVGSVVRYEDVALQVLASADLDQARRFVGWQLGPLAGTSEADRQLAATLRAYLVNESNLRATAAAMGIHFNTVANRLRRIEELLESRIAGRAAELLLALELLELTHPPRLTTLAQTSGGYATAAT
jgi:DNA-binding PucR family transcriptional regulator